MPKGQGIFKMPKNAKRARKLNSAKGARKHKMPKGQENFFGDPLFPPGY